MRAAIYTRISDDSTGERAGVIRQLEDCEALAQRYGADIVARFDDNDISAYNGKTRPGFEAMLDMLKRGQADTIICWHPDRLYRSMKDLERLIDIIDTGGINIRTCNGGDLDLSNSTGRMLARILGSVSRQESEHKAERRARANLQRAAGGTWRADQPRLFGYTRTGELLEPEASAIRQAIHGVLAGRSLHSIARQWNQQGLHTPQAPAKNATRRFGGNPWNNMSVRRVLLKPTHAGLRVHQGKVVGRGNWEPIVDEDVHHALVALLTDPRRRSSSLFERRHMGSAVYRCGICGNKLYVITNGTGALIYGCRPSKHLARYGDPLDEYVSAIVLELLRRNDVTNRLNPSPDVDVTALGIRREALRARKEQLAALFAAGDIDAPQLTRGTKDLNEQLADAEKELAAAVRTSPVAAMLADGVDKVQEHWDAATPDLRGKIVDELMTVTLLPTHGRKGVDRDGVIIAEYVRVEPRL